MFKCECGREFTRQCSLSYHKRFCGKNKISLDGGYEYFIDNNGNPVYVHRFIAEQKLGRKLLPTEEPHHKDGNKRNNNPDNIEVLLVPDHRRYYAKINNFQKIGRQSQIGSKHHQAKLNENIIKDIRNRLTQGETGLFISRLYLVDPTLISQIKSGKLWSHVV